MHPSQVLRIGAVVLIVGGIVGVVSTLASPTAADPNEQLASPLWAPAQLLGMVAGILTVIALPAVYARMARRTGAIGLLGFVALMVTGIMLGFFPFAVTLLVLPWLAGLPIPASELQNGPPSFFVYFSVASLFALVGSILFGLAIIRSGVFSRWPGYLLLVAGLANLVTTFLGDVPDPVWMAAPVLFNLGLAWLGYDLWKTPEEVDIGGREEPRDLAA